MYLTDVKAMNACVATIKTLVKLMVFKPKMPKGPNYNFLSLPTTSLTSRFVASWPRVTGLKTKAQINAEATAPVQAYALLLLRLPKAPISK